MDSTVVYQTTNMSGNVIFQDGIFSHAGARYFLRLSGTKYQLWDGLPSFEISGGGLLANTLEFAGMCKDEPYFTDGSHTLWRGVLMQTSYPREPEQWTGFELYYDENEAAKYRETTVGDTYWSHSAFAPWSLEESITLTVHPIDLDAGRGECTLRRDLSRIYTSDTLLGIYDRLDGRGKKLVGIPVWKDGNGREFKRTGTDGSYDCGGIVYNAVSDTWILGDFGSDSGWWQSTDAPSLFAPVTFTFCKNDDLDAEGENFTLTFSHCVSNGKRDILLAEVARWL